VARSAAVALRAHARARCRWHDADLHLVDARLLIAEEVSSFRFLVHLSTLVSPVNGSVCARAVVRPMMASRSGSITIALFDDVARFDAVHGAAILLLDDHVLRDRRRAAGQVALVGGLERRIVRPCARRGSNEDCSTVGRHGSST